MATHREFGGKQYRCDMHYKEKATATKIAASHRKSGWNARVVKEGEQYALYVRRVV